MKKYKIGLLVSVILILGSFSFPMISFAADSGDTAREVAQDATESEWNDMKDFFTQTPMPSTEGYSRGTQFPDDFQYECKSWERNEYSYSGPATRIITNIRSSDSDTVSVNYTKNNIQLVRGKGTSNKVTITIEYQLNWSFHVQEDVLGVWWDVSDQFGPSGKFTDSFEVNVSQKQFSVVPKTNNEVELHSFSSSTYDPQNFVNISGNTGAISTTYKVTPDDSRLGLTSATVVFSDGKNALTVDIPINIVDTSPPDGTLKNPIEYEIGSNTKLKDFFLSVPFDNDWQDVSITPSIDVKKLSIGTYPYSVTLTDSSGNQSVVSSTLKVQDTTAPKVQTKDIIVDFNTKIKPEDFIVSVTDNDFDGQLGYMLNSLTGVLPDTTKVGDQTVQLFVYDQSGNGVTVPAKLTVLADTIAPTALGEQQFLSLNKNDWEPDPMKLLKDIKDNGKLSDLTASYVQYPNSSKEGLSKAIVRLTDGNQNSSDIEVPFFVFDPNTTSYSDTVALSAQNFTIYSDEVDVNNQTKLEKLILDKSRVKGWNVVDGKDVTASIHVLQNNIVAKFGTYSATIKLDNVERTITVNVLDSADLVDVSIPQKVLFGSTDLNKGAIISPNYQIINHSTVGLDISLEKITVDSSSTVQLLDKDSKVPNDIQEAVQLYLKTDLLADYIALQESNHDIYIGKLKPQEKSEIYLNGSYYGDYSTTQKLNLDMVFKLEAVH